MLKYNHNYHSHTQFCDGHAPMEAMAAAAREAGMEVWGFSPHSPLPIPSPCNMAREDVEPYLREAERLRRLHAPDMRILTGMEIDRLDSRWGPHIDYFADLPLDYRIGSVHFVATQSGELIDCDGSAPRFARNLHDHFRDDLRYVIDSYFNSVKEMIDRGGFDIVGHIDKIAGNACAVKEGVEMEDWFMSHVQETLGMAMEGGLTVEINIKAEGRIFPAPHWWGSLRGYDSTTLTTPSGLILPGVVISSDTHWPDRLKTDLARSIASSFPDFNK
ncbi:MAG: PHP domain-containing protein [Muribaculaceae bacterium]|nr:PHP domain-containing protein [Muribaculaceae bacterium]